jgi:succinoglycan biosynthesis transport protein ExoP
MSLRAYLLIFWRRKWIIVATIVATTLLATVLTLLATPIYISSATLRVATVGSGAIDVSRPDIGYTERLMNTYARIITGEGTRNDIVEQLNLDHPPVISVELIPDTELIKISTESTEPGMARDVTNAVSEMLIVQSKELYAGGGQTTQEIISRQIAQIEEELNQARSDYERLLLTSPTDSVAISAASQSIELKERTYAYLLEQYEGARVNEALRANAVTIVEPATTPRQPSKPRSELNIVLGVLVGSVLGVGLALLWENLDTKLYTSEEIEEVTQMVPAGKIPLAKNQLDIIDHQNSYQPQLEAFRRLRTNILNSNREQKSVALLVTSAERGEGKSTIVANLAVVIAQSGMRVLVVDCDLRQPTIHKIFNVPNQRGLTDILVGEKPLSEVTSHSTYNRVLVVTSGPLPPNATELLGSSQMADLVEEMKEEYDVVLIDTPALSSVADAAGLVPCVDDVILVVAQARVHHEAIQTVFDQLTNIKPKSISVVVNRSDTNKKIGYNNFANHNKEESIGN